MLRKDVITQFELDRSSANPEEVARFSALALEWWKPDGAFKAVHRFNAARLTYLKARLPEWTSLGASGERPLEGLRILDVGCGAGLVAEPLAGLGAEVVGIDASRRNIEIARGHARAGGVAVDYRHKLPEQLAEGGERFDVVLALEVVEHVADVPLFLGACAALTGSGGVLAMATLNRTTKSFLFGIVGAEYVLRLLPRGTHDWRKFIRPEELRSGLAPHGLHEIEIAGMALNPLTGKFKMTGNPSVNFVQTFRRAAPMPGGRAS
ncbi:MAG: bifunctional 2-polyprenyl-6-hydroxyphenol methylase/3-demethylubiquinol 3-O-methyltransferase UbiG [Methyloligellaceae bacterium]